MVSGLFDAGMMPPAAAPAGAAPIPIRFHRKYTEEEYQFLFRQHWVRLVPSLARLFLVSVLLAAAAATLLLFADTPLLEPATRRGIAVLIALLFILVQVDILEHLYNHFLYVVIVTDRRIHRFKKTLFLTDDIQSVDLWVLQDIVKHQRGIVQNGLGFGTIEIEAQETIFKIHFVPDIDRKYHDLMRLREQARRKAAAIGQLPRQA
ncbi:MAG: hypothetical protein PHW10_04690 [Candidatus Peribacteraceae bacterium]|nr:hypothetical protein [Candidatus Peribacteraceae bacterium]